MRIIALVVITTACTPLPNKAYEAYELSQQCREALYKLPAPTPSPIPTPITCIQLEACEARIKALEDDVRYYSDLYFEKTCD